MIRQSCGSSIIYVSSNAIQMLVWFFWYRTFFLRVNLIQILAEMPGIFHSSEVHGEQFELVGERTFNKNRIHFMNAIAVQDVQINDEQCWPVKLRHQSTGRIKWVYLHEDETTFRAFVKETVENEPKSEDTYPDILDEFKQLYMQQTV